MTPTYDSAANNRPGRRDGARRLGGEQSGAAPGETHMVEQSWAVDGLGGALAKPLPLAPGSYTIRGHVFGEHLRAESAPLPVRVEPAPPAS